MVENAIIDLISCTIIARNEDQHNVNNGIIYTKTSKIIITSIQIIIKGENIIPKYTPAITIVELCNKALHGVGADIEDNNQLLKGNAADFVLININNNNIIITNI